MQLLKPSSILPLLSRTDTSASVISTTRCDLCFGAWITVINLYRSCVKSLFKSFRRLGVRKVSKYSFRLSGRSSPCFSLIVFVGACGAPKIIIFISLGLLSVIVAIRASSLFCAITSWIVSFAVVSLQWITSLSPRVAKQFEIQGAAAVQLLSSWRSLCVGKLTSFGDIINVGSSFGGCFSFERRTVGELGSLLLLLSSVYVVVSGPPS